MERIVTLHIGKLPDGVYLATSDDVQGLVAQGGTIQETLESAHDGARKLTELRGETADLSWSVELRGSCDYPPIVNA